jgi:hypothetical protein
MGQEIAKRVERGMVVRTAEGLRIGRVLHCGEATFSVGRDQGFPTEHLCRYEDVENVGAGQLTLRQDWKQMTGRAEIPSPLGP